MSGSVLAAVDDMFFAAKIAETAKGLGVPLVFARDAADVLDKVRAQRPSLLIIDLNSTACRPVESIRALKADPHTEGIRILGFVSHVQVALKEAAVAAGADAVLPRSAFSQNLPALLVAAAAKDPESDE